MVVCYLCYIMKNFVPVQYLVFMVLFLFVTFATFYFLFLFLLICLSTVVSSAEAAILLVKYFFVFLYGNFQSIVHIVFKSPF